MRSASESFAAVASLASNTPASSARFSSCRASTFFLDGAGGDELVARHDAALADAVRAVGGLRLGGGIPPWVEMHDGVGAREVQAGAAGLEREEENRRGFGSGGALETIHLGLAGARRHRAVEVAVRDLLRVELSAEEREEGSELREHEHAVAVVDGLGEEFGKVFQLRGHVRGRIGRDEPRVAANLAEAEKLRQRGELEPGLARAAGLEIEELALAALLRVAVEPGLGGAELAPDRVLEFRGQSRARRRAWVRRRM